VVVRDRSSVENAPADTLLIEGVDVASLFVPGEDLPACAQLLEVAWRRRQAALLALELMVARERPGEWKLSGFKDAMEIYKRLQPSVRRRLVEHPPFRVWLKLATNLLAGPVKPDPVRGAEVENRLAQFKCLISDVLEQPRPQPFLVQRYSVDPLIAEVAPPSYIFKEFEPKHALESSRPYTLAFFREVAEAALRRIETVWPAFATLFSQFVKIVVHLPEAEFRSCSAHRFAGVVMLSAQDDSLFAVEESLIHEWAHQVLYCLMELDPLVEHDGEKMFTLPWSGAERDFYGYFHAAYVYWVLAVYMARAIGREPNEDIAIRARLLTILSGLDKGIADLGTVSAFTPAGRLFFDRLAACATRALSSDEPWLIGFSD
jgi:hypothetical protein